MKAYIENRMRELESKDNLTAYERARLDECKRILANGADCGRYGKAFEILSVKTSSRKTAVSAQNRADGYFTFNGKRTKAVEKKTNGGRIESLYRLKKPENAFIVYRLDFETRVTYRKDGTPRETRHYETPDLLLRVSDFLAILEHCNAVKVIGHADKNDNERAVQGDSVKLYKVLSEYPIPFEPDAEYCSEDFEDLILW